MAVTILTGDCRDVLRTLPDESVHCVVTSPPEILAYCAGVIDSDGYIGIRRSTYAMRVTRDSRQPVYMIRVCVKQVTPEAIGVLVEAFGGRAVIQPPSAARGKPLYRWEIGHSRAEACLRALVPFLRIKRAQAENCLTLRSTIAESKVARVAKGRGHAGSAARPAALSERMEAAYQRGKTLNRVGV